MFKLSQVIDGYTLAAHARRLSEHTLADYSNTFRKFQLFLADDPPFDQIDRASIAAFLSAQTVSDKTLLNYHTGLSALWTWAAAEGYAAQNPLRQIERPRPETRAIVPLSEADLRAMLNALARSRTYNNRGSTASNALPNQDRNRAIILLLLDTGMRAEELCRATLQDLDLKNQYIKVFGKGNKERVLPICSRTAQVLWKYIAQRGDPLPGSPIFLTEDGTPLDRHRLLKQLRAIGQRAGVRGAHPHRFRHTFAINFLRNGGNVYTLQMLLGHTTLDMCKKYLNIAQADLQSIHRLASPVANWRL